MKIFLKRLYYLRKNITEIRKIFNEQFFFPTILINKIENFYYDEETKNLMIDKNSNWIIHEFN